MNLEQELGSVWRIKKDPAWIKPRSERSAEVRAIAREDNPSLFVVECRKGGKVSGVKANIFTHSATHYGFIGKGRGLRPALLAIPGVELWQSGDEEFSVIFPKSVFAAVAGVVSPYRRKTTPV